LVVERRELVRHEPTSPTEALLLWKDEAGTHQASGLLADLTERGCAMVVADAPLLDFGAVVRLSFPGTDTATILGCRIMSRNPHGDTVLVSMRFDHPTEAAVESVRSAIASGAFEPLREDTIQYRRKFWRESQWSSFLSVQRLPVMPRSKTALAALAAEKGEELSSHDLATLALSDPFLCLVLLREAEARRASRLGHETSTPLAAVMQIGDESFRELLLASPETDEGADGLCACEARAVLAGQLAAAWSALRADAAPDEVSMAALLSEIGELMLWHFAPELPQAVLDVRASGQAHRTVEAQQLACGFKFHELTLRCAELWNLPAILTQLIRGQDNARARLARVAQNTARHLIADPGNAALPDDVADVKALIPDAAIADVVGKVPGLSEEARAELIESATAAMEKRTHSDEHPA
jgi:HD-like signal output (HDOD) protein